MARLLQLCCTLLAVVVAIVAGFWTRYGMQELNLTPVDLTGKTVLITGATDGIGKESAKIMASWGANLILPVRNSKKAEEAKREILEACDGKKISVEVVPGVDFADLSTVRAFAEKLQNRPIDVLMNNAGIAAVASQKTVDGYESVFQVNHLAPFLLTHLLLPSLNLAKNPRVVFVSSLNHFFGHLGTTKYSVENVGLGNLFFNTRYDDSKLMNVMTAKSFADKYKDSKVTFNSLHPGFVISNIDDSLLKPLVSRVRGLIGRNTNQGAVTQVVVATHPKLEGVTGRYFSDHCINHLCRAPCFMCDSTNPPGATTNSEVNNKTARDWLWETSCKLTKLDC